VDGLERELEDRAQVLRLNVMDNIGGELAIRYRVQGVPTLVVLDGKGQVVLTQTGVLDKEKILTVVKELKKE
jgi:thioredoxin-related protein